MVTIIIESNNHPDLKEEISKEEKTGCCTYSMVKQKWMEIYNLMCHK